MYDNNMFGKGSIVIANNSAALPAFLYGRPLVVVSDYIPIMSKIVVAEITTKDQPGIKCRLRGTRYGDANAIVDSVILPYSLFTIPTNAVYKYCGMLDRRIMEEVDNSVKFFLGYNDEIPKYIKDAKTLYPNIEYNIPEDSSNIIENPNEEKCRRNDKHLRKNNKRLNSNKAKRYNVFELYNPSLSKDFDIERWLNHPVSFDQLSIVDKTIIISRMVTLKELEKKLSKSNGTITEYRKILTDEAINIAKDVISNNDYPKDDFTAIGIAIAIIYYPEILNEKTSEYVQNIKQIISEYLEVYNIDFSDKGTWKSTLKAPRFKKN